MTENTADAISAAQTANAHALAKAREDAATYERLKGAAAEVRRLMREGDELTAAFSKAQADEADAEVAAIADQYRNFTVSAGPLRAGAAVNIGYERLRYSMSTRQNEWTPERVEGFHFLEPLVLRYLTKHKAGLIPSSILALAPGDAWEAVQRFIVARGRNFA